MWSWLSPTGTRISPGNEEESQSCDSCVKFWSDVEAVAMIYCSSRFKCCFIYFSDLVFALFLLSILKYFHLFISSFSCDFLRVSFHFLLFMFSVSNLNKETPQLL